MSITPFELLQETNDSPSSGSSARTDSVTENAVEHGIRLQRTLGTACAIEYLRAHGVSHHISYRVLTKPERRRSHNE